MADRLPTLARTANPTRRRGAATPTTLPKHRRSMRAQALVETGIVVVMLTFLVLGIMEVGWAFMRLNMITHAARDGARWGATLDKTLRDATTGCFTGGGTSSIETHVTTALSSVGFTPSAINVSQGGCGATPVPTIQVQIVGTMNMLFNFIGTSYPIDRSVTFEDEGRVCNGTC